MTATPNRERPHDAILTSDGWRRLTARARRLREEVITRLRKLRDGHERDDLVQLEYQRATRGLERIGMLLTNATPTDGLPDDPDAVELGRPTRDHRAHP